MEKILDFYYGDNNSEVLEFVDTHLIKKAEYSPELQDFILNKLVPKQGKTYALVNALSAGEYYGSNRNGDYFPSEVLKKYHKTFEQFGHVYKHHINKDPKNSFGKVIFSHYNDRMHRVELIVELDNEKAKDIIEELNSGKLPKVSMGCKVPYDVCSICGNKAKTRAEYCNHLKKEMNKVLSNGKKVYAINTEPKFFDLSIVTIPADQTASILKKIEKSISKKEAEYKPFAFLTESGYIKTASMKNTAEIKKEVNGNLEKVPEELLALTSKKIDKKKIEKISSYPLNEILSTFLVLRIFPDKEDFQKLSFYSVGKKEEADLLESNNIVFEVTKDTKVIELEDVNCDNFNEKIAEIIFDDLVDLSLTKEFIVSRSLLKMAQIEGEQNIINNENIQKFKPKNPIIPLSVLGALYLGYATLFNDPAKSKFTSFVAKNPWVVPVLVGAGTLGSIYAQKGLFEKQAMGTVGKFLRNSLITVPLSYIYAGSQENKALMGEPLNKFQNFARKNPALIGFASAFAGAKVPKLFKSSSVKVAEFVASLPEDHLNKIFNDLKNIWR